MKRTFPLPLLLLALCLVFIAQGCTSPTCKDYLQQLDCSEQIIAEYGSKIISDKDQTKTPTTCTSENERQNCGTGNRCIRSKGSAFAVCYAPGSTFDRFNGIVEAISGRCTPIFAVRQAGNQSYYECLTQAKCDAHKISECGTLLKRETTSSTGDGLIGYLVFVLLVLLLEGLLLFGILKLIDRQNPKTTLVRALSFALVIGLISFPLIYLSPLLGLLISSSLLFGIILILFHQGIAMPVFYTAFHIVWISVFFNFMVANQNFGNDAWLFEPQNLRIVLAEEHERLSKLVTEQKQQQKNLEDEQKRLEEEKRKKAQPPPTPDPKDTNDTKDTGDE